MTTTYRIRLDPKIYADVTGDYYSGFPGTREYPPEHESVTLRAVIIGGVNVIDDLSDEQLDAIEAAWLQAFHEERAESAQNPDVWKL